MIIQGNGQLFRINYLLVININIEKHSKGLMNIGTWFR